MRGYIFNMETMQKEFGMEKKYFERYYPLLCGFIKESEQLAKIEEFENLFMILAGNEFIADWDENGTYFIFTESGKKKYFHERYELFKKQVSELTLEQFSNGSQELWKIEQGIDNTQGDCVFSQGVLCTFDEFIRTADAETKYYLNTEQLFCMYE